MELPNKRYKCILADPPWEQGKTGKRQCRPNQGTKLDYPTMSLQEIISLPVMDLAQDDSLLFLWTTDKHIVDAHYVMEHWEFKKHCIFVWNKNTGVCPFSVQFRNEYMLMGYHGRLKLRTIGIPTNFQAPITKHSEKPLISYEIIDKLAYEPKIELFARRLFPGWDAWGNEVPINCQKLLATEDA